MKLQGNRATGQHFQQLYFQVIFSAVIFSADIFSSYIFSSYIFKLYFQQIYFQVIFSSYIFNSLYFFKSFSMFLCSWIFLGTTTYYEIVGQQGKRATVIFSTVYIFNSLYFQQFIFSIVIFSQYNCCYMLFANVFYNNTSLYRNLELLTGTIILLLS